jgi:predicted phosphodiesterase
VSDRRYRAAIARGLDAALARAAALSWDMQTDPVIVLSDLHRGQGDHADDFRFSAETYRRALRFYLDAGYGLVTLGDAEELWEGWPRKVIPTYRDVLELEARFHIGPGGRFHKVWGNHDDLWQYPDQVKRHLGPVFGELRVPDALIVTVTRRETAVGTIFLVHGHQGTGSSDRWGGISCVFVRWVWRPVQRLFKVSLNTPATDFEIRGRHDRAMYEWAAARNDLVLVAGHTHNPVFVSKPHVATLERVHDHLSDTPDRSAEAAQLDLEISWAKNEDSEAEPAAGPRDRGCYFNSGCCCFSNGDITGIDAIVATIRRIVEVGGVDTVAVGSDLDGFTDPPDDLVDISEMPKLTDALLQDGFGETEIEKILGGNMMQVLRDGWR